VPTKTYKIAFVLDDSAAKASYARGVKGLSDVEKAALKAATAIEKAMAHAGQVAAHGAQAQVAATNQATNAAVKGAQAQAKAHKTAAQQIDVGYYKMVVDSIKGQDKLRAAHEKKAQQIEALESRYAAKDYQRRVKAEAKRQAMDDFARSRTAKAIRDQETLELSYSVRDYQRRVAAARRVASLEEGAYGRLAKFKRRVLTDEQVQAVGVNKAIDASNKKRIDAAMRAHGEEKDAFAEGIAQAFGFSGAVTGIGVAFAGLAVGKTVLGGIAGAFAQAKQNADDMARKTLDTYAALKALASVAGRDSNGQFGSEVLGFAQKTGMSGHDASTFQEGFLGRSQIVKGVTIGAKGFDKYMEGAGTLAAGKGIPADVAGDLFGGVLKGEDFRKQAPKDEAKQAKLALGRAAGALDILDAGSGKMPVLGPQLNQLLAALTSEDALKGVFRNAGEAAVATSAAAEFNPEEASVLTQRTASGLRDTGNKNKAGFFKQSGISNKDSFFEALAKAKPLLDKEVAKGVPVDEALTKFGFSEIRENRGLRTFYNAYDKVVTPQLGRLSGATPEAAEAKLAAIRGQKTFKDASSLAAVEKARFERGKLGEDLRIGKQEAEAQMVGEGFFDRPLSRLYSGVVSASSFGQVDGDKALIEARAVENARKAAGVGGVRGAFSTPGEAVRNLAGRNPLAEPIAQAAQHLFGDSSGEVRKLTAAIERANRLAEARQGVAPAPLPVGRAQGPIRP
jgi:hypothetical protein